MTAKPTKEQAAEAEQALESSILKFSSDARAPYERNTPDENPTWTPRLSTLRYSPLRGGGVIWAMDADDQQLVAYYVTLPNSEALSRVTTHGQARHNFQEMLKVKHIFPTASPYIEWYDFRTQHHLDSKMSRGGIL